MYDYRVHCKCTKYSTIPLFYFQFLQPTEHKEIITHMAKMVENIMVPMARASILWLIGEYSDRVPKIAPDVLRIMAKSFINEVMLVYDNIIMKRICFSC